MLHIAIMKKSWGLLPKILDGSKKIESRWYKNRYSPWGKIARGDFIYFKNSGEMVTVRANVDHVLEFSGLTPDKVGQILKEYGTLDGLEKSQIPKYFKLFKDKNYCLLIFLKDVEGVKPFGINKKGYGAMSSWICARNIKQLTT